MGKVYDVFDKFSIISIAIGFILGLYLAVNHNDSNLWLRSIPFILAFSFIMTLPPLISVVMDNVKNNVKFPIKDIIEAFFLNVGMITVCMAFGVVIGSFIIGNVIIDNGKLSNLLHFG
ncbi:MAG: hypothetical protein UIB63_05315 [Methanobrevibacter sp.]|uniref:hypothetical protein n=1 Tax=Methanobrevibacter sp. TaxID=66852 RepID=UPI002E779037|nr:hypothetical protein [Methanobrevibacter sp.]MEE0942515.1 hypothetical protein [Methanobrevibacter sp.]